MSFNTRNTGYTRLNGSINSSITAIVVQDARAFINGSKQHYVQVDSEIMLCSATDHTTHTLTVVRGQLGTTAASHDSLSYIRSIIFKETIDSLEDDLKGTVTTSSTSQNGISPFLNSVNHSFDPGINSKIFYGFSPNIPPPTTGWTNRITYNGSRLHGWCTHDYGINFSLRRNSTPVNLAYDRAITIPYDVRLGVWHSGSNTSFVAHGVYVMSTTANHRLSINHYQDFIAVGDETYSGNFNGSYDGALANLYSGAVYSSRYTFGGTLSYWRITNDAVNRKFYASMDGTKWKEVFSHSSSSVFSDETRFGFTAWDGFAPTGISNAGIIFHYESI